jgi:alanine dehydrogenase
MIVLDANVIEARLSMLSLVDALKEAFAKDWLTPPRTVSAIPGGAGDRLALTMPAFAYDGAGIVKVATYVPDNAPAHKPTIQGVIIVLGEDGAPHAVLDGAAITNWRTAAASALASSYLSRPESAHILLIGSGALAPYMAEAHARVRPIERISVFARRSEAAHSTAAAIRARTRNALHVDVAESVKEAVQTADIICCATSAVDPVFRGATLRPGAHVDLVGSFSPQRREADDDAVLRARVFVDTLEGALSEAGDLIQPMARGLISGDHIMGELRTLVRGEVQGRLRASDITLFKSVGASIEDLAAARLALQC